MKDRLEQLKAEQLTQDDDAEEVEIAVDNTAFMDEFFAEIEDTRLNIDKISEHVDEAKKLYSVILSAPIPEPKTKDDLEQLTAEIKKRANNVRNKLKSEPLCRRYGEAHRGGRGAVVRGPAHPEVAALGPVPEVRGGDDPVQRGPGGLPRAQQGADPAAARDHGQEDDGRGAGGDAGEREPRHLHRRDHRLADLQASAERDRGAAQGHRAAGEQHQGAARHVRGHRDAGGEPGGDAGQHRAERPAHGGARGEGARGDQAGGQVPRPGPEEIDNYHCGSSGVAGHFSVDYWTFRWAEVMVARAAAALKCLPMLPSAAALRTDELLPPLPPLEPDPLQPAVATLVFRWERSPRGLPEWDLFLCFLVTVLGPDPANSGPGGS